MSLEHILLGQLRRPATGYQLGKDFAESSGHFWPAERSQIYPALKRLQARGWLRCEDAPSARGPRRKVYATTTAGLAELQRWLSEGPQIGRERLAFIAQIFYMGALEDQAAALAMVHRLRDQWARTLSLFESYEVGAQHEVGGWDTCGEDDFFAISALRGGVHLMRAKLAWCDEMTSRIEARLDDAGARASVPDTRAGDTPTFDTPTPDNTSTKAN